MIYKKKGLEKGFTSYSNHHNEYNIAIHLFLHRVLIRESRQIRI